MLDVYGTQRVVKAVDDVNLDIRENEVDGIAGESGCGKTTLLKALAAAIEPPLRLVGGKVVTIDTYPDFRTDLDRIAAAGREATDLQRLDWLGQEDLVTALVAWTDEIVHVFRPCRPLIGAKRR